MSAPPAELDVTTSPSRPAALVRHLPPWDPGSAVAALVAGLGLVAAGIGLGLFVTHVGAEGTGELALDTTLGEGRNSLLVVLSHLIDAGFNGAFGGLWLLGLSLVLWLRRREAGVAFAVVAATAWLPTGLAKLAFARMHPPMSTVQALTVESEPTSFPSGHTAFAVAVVAGLLVVAWLAGRPTRWIWVAGVPFVVFVGFSRLYLGAHFFGDVLAAPLFSVGGVLLLLGTLALLRRPLPVAP